MRFLVEMEQSEPSTSTHNKIVSLPQYLYHYTTYENLRKILKDGKVSQSNAVTAYINGPGVYLTSLSPEAGQNRIYWNNKGGRTNFTETFLDFNPNALSVKCYIKFDTNHLKSNLKITKDNKQQGRDVWVYHDDIFLQGTDSWYTFGFIDERGRLMAKLNQQHGKDGWNHSIKELSLDSTQETEDGWYSVTAYSIIRMELKDGTYHEDHGTGFAEGQSSIATDLKTRAKENAIVNGLRRAAHYFGFGEDFGGTPRTPLKRYGTPRKETPTRNFSSRLYDKETEIATKKRKLCFNLSSPDSDNGNLL